jgi:hypothetical protein
MSSEFAPNSFQFGDRAGQGRWEIGHYRQHLRYLSALAARSPPVILADHPIMTIGSTDLERRIFLNDHATVHNLLRPYANVTGIDLSAVNLTDEEQFYTWLDDHCSEHALLDAAVGVA